jgi:hypothetical protein
VLNRRAYGDAVPASIITARPLAIALALAAAGLAAAGCGSSSPSSSGGSAATMAAAARTPAARTPEVSPAGDIPDNQAYVRYAPPGAGFSVKVPEGWSRTRTGGGVTFTDKLNAIRLEHAAPAAHTGRASSVQRRAGTAQKLTYTTRAQPNPVTGRAGTDAVERYVFTHAGRTAVLTLSGPKGADDVDPWRIVTDSLRWTP